MPTNAIELATALFVRICEMTEAKLENHLEKFGSVEEKAELEAPRIPVIANEIANELRIKSPLCLNAVYIYLLHRPDLEIRTGKNAGVYPIKGKMTAKECSLKNYEAVKDCAPNIIDDEFRKVPKGFKLNFQDLSQVIADKLGIKQYASYHCLKQYVLEERQDDLVIDLGRYGGLRRL